jgi:hypothetical protein
VKKIFIVVVILAVGGITYWSLYGAPSDNLASIEFIQSRMFNGEIIDLQQDLRVEGVEDIKWYEKRNNIYIEYGTVLLKYPVSEFVKPEVQEDLNSILLETKQNAETLEFTLYFNGEEVTKYRETSFFDFL